MKYFDTTYNIGGVILLFLMAASPAYAHAPIFDSFLQHQEVGFRVWMVVLVVQLVMFALFYIPKWRLARRVRTSTKWMMHRIAQHSWFSLFLGWFLCSFTLQAYMAWTWLIVFLGFFLFYPVLLIGQLVVMSVGKWRKKMITGTRALYFWFWMSVSLVLAMVTLWIISYTSYDQWFVVVGGHPFIKHLERTSIEDVLSGILLFIPSLIAISVAWLIKGAKKA